MMGSLTKKPTILPTETFDTPATSIHAKLEQKKQKKTSIGLTVDTKKKINTLRKMKDFKNVDDLLLYLISQETEKFSDKEKMEFEIISKNI